MWAPMDDHHVMVFNLNAPRLQPGDARPFAPLPMALLPNNTDWFGRHRMANQPENDYLIDREVQRKNHGRMATPVLTAWALRTRPCRARQHRLEYDPTPEHLGSSDAMIIRVRRRLMAAARALAENGSVPPGVTTPRDTACVRVVSLPGKGRIGWKQLGNCSRPTATTTAWTSTNGPGLRSGAGTDAVDRDKRPRLGDAAEQATWQLPAHVVPHSMR